MAGDLNVVYSIGADISGLKTGVDQAANTALKLEKSASSIGVAFESGFKSAGRGIGTVTAELLLAQKEVGKLQKLVLENADKPGFVAALGYELDDAIPRVAALDKELRGLTKGLDDAAKPAGALSGWFNDFGSTLAGTAAGFLSAQAVIGGVSTAWRTLTGFVSDSVKAYAEAEASQVKLTTALRSQGMATPAVISQYKDLSEQFQQTTIFSDDLITEMQALLVQVGSVMPSEMDKALDAATNLAAGLGIDLETATTLVAKAAAGHTETLGRYGITVDQAALKTRGFDAVMEAINKQFGGQAAAQIETYAGKVKQLENSWDNVKEAVGKAIANDPLVISGLRAITDAAKETEDGVGGVAASYGLLSGILERSGLRGYADAVRIFENWARSANDAADATDRLKRVQNSIKPVASHETDTDRQEAEARKLAKAREDQAKADEEAAKAAKEYAAALAVVNKKIREAQAPTAKLSDVQQRLIKQFHELGLTNEEIALKMGLSTKSVGVFLDALDKTEQAIKSLKDTTLSGPLTGLRLYQADADVAELQKFIDKLRSIENGTFRAKVDPASLTGPIAGIALIKPEFEKADAARYDFQDGLRDLSQAFAHLSQVSGDSWGGIAQDIGQVIAAMNLAHQSAEQYQKATTAMGKAMALAGGAAAVWSAAGAGGTNTAASIGGGAAAGASAGSAFGPWGTAVGAGVGALVGWYRSEKAARQVNDVRDAFIAQAGGLDMLNRRAHEAKLTLDALLAADSAEELTNAMEQLNTEIGKLSATSQLLDEASRMFGPSQADLEKTEKHLHAIFDAMTEAGTYSAEQLNKAYYAWQKAMADAGNEAAAAWVKAHDEANAGAQAADDAMSKLIARRDELAKGIANEAPEEVMGVIESQMRAQMAALDAEIAAANEAQTTAAAEAAKDTAGEFRSQTDEWTKYAEQRGGEAARQIHDSFDFTIHIPIEFDVPSVPTPTTPSTPTVPGVATGGLVTTTGIRHFATGGFARGTDTVPAMLTPGELVLNAAQQDRIGDALEAALALASRQSDSGPQTVQVLLDGHVVAENTVTRMAQDKRGIGTKARRALGVPG